MPTESGLTSDFSKVDLVIGPGFRVDAYADAGFTVAWQGDQYTVATGADSINVIVAVNNEFATLTANLMQSSIFLDYVSTWFASGGGSRRLSFEDRNGRTIMSAPKAVPRQKPNMTFNNAANFPAIDILCPNLRGFIGGLN